MSMNLDSGRALDLREIRDANPGGYDKAIRFVARHDPDPVVTATVVRGEDQFSFEIAMEEFITVAAAVIGDLTGGVVLDCPAGESGAADSPAAS